ncbi:hypothetical protein KM043_004415 [Ampulex compressa]|nr:hypothetical protein KM043_004415 [Ampulex compressa]
MSMGIMAWISRPPAMMTTAMSYKPRRVPRYGPSEASSKFPPRASRPFMAGQHLLPFAATAKVLPPISLWTVTPRVGGMGGDHDSKEGASEEDDESEIRKYINKRGPFKDEKLACKTTGVETPWNETRLLEVRNFGTALSRKVMHGQPQEPVNKQPVEVLYKEEDQQRTKVKTTTRKP